MEYSYYATEQIVSPMYKEVAKKLLNSAKDEDIRKKMERHSI